MNRVAFQKLFIYWQWNILYQLVRIIFQCIGIPWSSPWTDTTSFSVTLRSFYDVEIEMDEYNTVFLMPLASLCPLRIRRNLSIGKKENINRQSIRDDTPVK